MRQVRSSIVYLLILSFNPVFLYGAVYYSRLDGNWKNASTWSLDPGGSPASSVSPASTDTVYISHDIELPLSSNYTHYGNIIVYVGGGLETYRTGTRKQMIFAGAEMHIWGDFMTDGDFYVGRDWSSDTPLLSVYEGGSIDVGDDLILCGGSATYIHSTTCGAAVTADDIYFRGPDAYMCGGGHFVVPDKLRIWDETQSEIVGASSTTEIGQQLCDGFPIYADVPNCNVQVPIVTGTGSFTLALPPLKASWVPRDRFMELHWENQRDLDIQHWEILGWTKKGGPVRYQVRLSAEADFWTLPGRYDLTFVQLKGILLNGEQLQTHVLPVPLRQVAKPRLSLKESGMLLSGASPGETLEWEGLDLSGRQIWSRTTLADSEGNVSLEVPARSKGIIRVKGRGWSLSKALLR